MPISKEEAREALAAYIAQEVENQHVYILFWVLDVLCTKPLQHGVEIKIHQSISLAAGKDELIQAAERLNLFATNGDHDRKIPVEVPQWMWDMHRDLKKRYEEIYPPTEDTQDDAPE